MCTWQLMRLLNRGPIPILCLFSAFSRVDEGHQHQAWCLDEVLSLFHHLGLVAMQGAAAADKEAVLLALCSRSFCSGRTIVFFRTKHQAHRVKMLFGLAGLPPAAELHGNMTQAARLESLDCFRKVPHLTRMPLFPLLTSACPPVPALQLPSIPCKGSDACGWRHPPHRHPQALGAMLPDLACAAGWVLWLNLTAPAPAAL